MKLLIPSIALFSVLIAAKVAYLASMEANEAYALSDQLRNELEAAWRTQGRVDQAYICKLRSIASIQEE